MIETTVYLICALTSSLCAVLLFREYRWSRARLSLWSAVAFCGLALNNVLLYLDLVLVPNVDLAVVLGLGVSRSRSG